MRYYLLNDCAQDTGESFLSLVEVQHWYYDAMGEWPDTTTKKAMREGRAFIVGSRSYTIEQRKTQSLACAVA